MPPCPQDTGAGPGVDTRSRGAGGKPAPLSPRAVSAHQLRLYEKCGWATLLIHHTCPRLLRQWQSQVVARETKWPPKLNTVPVGAFVESAGLTRPRTGPLCTAGESRVGPQPHTAQDSRAVALLLDTPTAEDRSPQTRALVRNFQPCTCVSLGTPDSPNRPRDPQE